MVVRELRHPSTAEFRKMADILTDAFWKTPLFSQFLFPGRKPLARTFMEALLVYGKRTGRIFAAEDGEQGIIACAVWSGPDSEELNLKGYLKLGMWPRMLYIALRSPAAMRRVHEMLTMLERYAPEEPCATLEFLASARKGAGAELVRKSMRSFGNLPLYVESIVAKDDHAYYRQFGFVPFARTDFHGTDYAFLLAKPQKAPRG